MNDIERQIRDAKEASRLRTQKNDGVNITPPHIDKSAAMVTMAAGARLVQNQYQSEESGKTRVKVDPVLPDIAEERGTATSTFYTSTAPSFEELAAQHLQQKSSRPGVISGFWHNAYILAAMPVLQLVESSRGVSEDGAVALRVQFEREIQHFHQVLLKQHVLAEDVHRMGYLLCTYIDGSCGDIQESKRIRFNLLVTFYRDSWGGERCFHDLKNYMADPGQYFDILELYHLILSLGFKGQYRMQERGDVLLMDLRIRLHTILYEKNPLPEITHLTPIINSKKSSYFTPLRLWGYSMLVFLLAWGSLSFYLHDKSRDVRNSILAWEPPAPRKINIMETLPQPLPKILSEGWLNVREDPRGWLLIFTSDGAFRTGKAVLSAEFVENRNIERLGEALAGWPGDLEVIGHTDAQPFRNSPNNSNMKLSLDRAKSVADGLREGSLVNSKYQREIVAIGKGDTEPLADNSTEEGRRKNRRVDILWKVGKRDNQPIDNNIYEK